MDQGEDTPAYQRLVDRIRACTLCAADFAATATAHAPRPVVWFAPTARILIAGQAPGARVQASGTPFTDPSGDRLRDWLGMDEAAFYDQSRVAIVPMAFCFPGYDAKGRDLPPPARCATAWRKAVMAHLPHLQLVLAVGGAAQSWHLQTRNVTRTVAGWRDWRDKTGVWPLPHPSWRNTGWIGKNPWFTAELLPELRACLRQVMKGPEG